MVKPLKVKSWNTFKLFSDNDKDGVANVFDCKPKNKKKQDDPSLDNLFVSVKAF